MTGADPLRFEMRGIRRTFGATVALDGVDLSVRAGEVCGLVGQNGAGKSTLMAILAGALAPDAGSMTMDGRPYAPRDPLDARRAGVAMIYQELSLAPHLSVMENILLGMEPARFGLLDWGRMRAAAVHALAQLGHDEIDPGQRVETLSVAAQQLVEIARAFASGCRVLVLDEPTSSLGREDVARLFDLVRRLRAQGHAIVYISHFIEEVSAIADRVVVLRDGRNAGGCEIAATTPGAIVAMMVGRQVGDLFPRSFRRRGEAILDVDRLEPGAATFTLHRGEIFGIAGLIGAGRTRLLRTIFGLAPVRSGRVTVATFSGASSPSDRWHQGAGILSEDRKNEGLAPGLTVADNLTLTRLETFGPAGFVSPARQHAAASGWIDRLDIRCAGAGQAVGELSGGNQQKVALARLLHHDVDVLILDEPTRGIDVASKAEIYALVDALVADAPGRRAKAILVVSSYLPELVGLCDRIAVMHRGTLGAPRDASGLTEHDLMMDATGTAHAT
jgi:ribose transport system ATP-binding protein